VTNVLEVLTWIKMKQNKQRVKEYILRVTCFPKYIRQTFRVLIFFKVSEQLWNDFFVFVFESPEVFDVLHVLNHSGCCSSSEKVFFINSSLWLVVILWWNDWWIKFYKFTLLKDLNILQVVCTVHKYNDKCLTNHEST